MFDHIFVAATTDSVAVIRTTPTFRQRAAICGPFDIIGEDIKKSILHSHFANEKGEHKYVVVAHFAEHVRKLLDEKCGSPLHSDRAWVCTSQVAWPLVHSGILSQRTLASLSEHFKVGMPGPAAEDQVFTLLCIYREMMRRYRTALLAEDAVTELGGNLVGSARKLMGF